MYCPYHTLGFCMAQSTPDDLTSGRGAVRSIAGLPPRPRPRLIFVQQWFEELHAQARLPVGRTCEWGRQGNGAERATV